MELKGKRILFFAPRFFGYEKEITKKLVVLGAEVDYYDERPGNSVFSKAMLRMNAKSMTGITNAYYEKIITRICTRDYDYVLVVNAEAITSSIIEELRRRFRNARFILYMWDSVCNKKNTLNLHQSFDRTYSFDRLDAENIKSIHFRPLFFCDDYAEREYANNKYDLAFAGTGHADRFIIVEKIKEYAIKDNLSLYSFLYLHTRLQYFYQSYKDRVFRAKASISSFSFQQLSKEELINILGNSKAIIDIQHPNQAGLTMRTFEMMAMGKKIITTNKDIVNYDFYSPDNVYVIDRNDPYIDANFLATPFKPVPAEILQQYSIGAWIEAILQ